jgi:phosphatidylglycerol:prolipoprotein diacylglycerol transferase
MNIAFSLPTGIPIYAFSLLLGIGATLGLAWVASQAPLNQVRLRVDAALWAILGGMLGGRIAFVLVNWTYFRSHIWESLAIFQGGMSWPGAVIGGALALLLAARLFQAPIGRLADAMLPLAASLAVSAWLGCWLTGCAYGPPANNIWGIPAVDEWGELASRWPTQLIGALLALVLFWILDRSRAWAITPAWLKHPGSPASLGLLGLSLEMLALSFLRADPSPGWQGLRLDAWAALALTILAAPPVLIAYLRWRQSAKEDQQELEVSRKQAH